jgi:hypothetical protein
LTVAAQSWTKAGDNSHAGGISNCPKEIHVGTRVVKGYRQESDRRAEWNGIQMTKRTAESGFQKSYDPWSKKTIRKGFFGV